MPRKAHPAPALGWLVASCWWLCELWLDRRYAAVVLVVSFHAVVPWAAMTGSHARCWVTTAYSWRRIAPATAVCAWVGVSRFCLATGEMAVAGGVHPVRLQAPPHRAPGGDPQLRPSGAGDPGLAGERAGLAFPRREAGVLDHGPRGGEPGQVAGLGEDRRGPDRGQPVDARHQRGQVELVEDGQPSAPRRP